MPDPRRFAGFASPAAVVWDRSLSRDQKIGALKAWRSTIERQDPIDHGEAECQRRLVAEIERALASIRDR